MCKLNLVLYVALHRILHPARFMVFLWLALGTWRVRAVSLLLQEEAGSSGQLFV